MIRHLIIAAWRNIVANKLLSAISILGLSVGIAAAILMGLVVRNQMTFDHFIPGHERIYMGVTRNERSGHPDSYTLLTHRSAAGLLRLNVPEIESVTRLMPRPAPGPYAGDSVLFRHDSIAGSENIYWAEPNVFDVLPLPVLYGNLSTSLQRPDGIVLPLAIARKYFGRDDVVGQTIDMDGHPMTVRAVIADLSPNNTELQSGIFASSLASFSAFSNDQPDIKTPTRKSFFLSVQTYLRLKPGGSIASVEAKVPQLVVARLGFPPSIKMTMLLPRLDQINTSDELNPGITAKLTIAGATGLLILVIASINFVNLLTASAARRTLEVGIRKVCGASRGKLISQFLCETFVVVLIATCLAAALVEFLLPYANTFLDTGAVFAFLSDPALLGSLVLGVVVLSLLAGAYPSFVLSGFRPSGVLKGLIAKSWIGDIIRNGLVTLQFTILVVLVIAAWVVFQQRSFAITNALRVDIDQMLIIRMPSSSGFSSSPCPEGLKSELRKLSGVRGAFCSGPEFLENTNIQIFTDRDNRIHTISLVPVDWGIFALYGVKPVAGSFNTFSATGDSGASTSGAVINQSAVKLLDYASAQHAIGKGVGVNSTNIVAVVPDFALYSVKKPVEPTLYSCICSNPGGDLIHLKLNGQMIPETLAAIDRVWKATGQTKAIDRFFLDQHMQELYSEVLRQAQFFAICAGVAVSLASLGLVGIAVSTAERRTKEIGIRKAMGAKTAEVVALLLWQFSQPVLWANVIAWPVAWWLMRRWLSGFAYHIELKWWVFASASAAALLIALLTVAGQAWLAARQKPVLALRYE